MTFGVDLGAHPDDVRLVSDRTSIRPRVAIVLGSGLDPLLAGLADRVDVPYTELKGFPKAGNVVGHAGELTLGRLGELETVYFRGRVHRYQGFSAYDASYPARLAHALGAETLVVTNAAGSVTSELAAGDLMLIGDHLNLMGDNPLVGWPGPPGGTPFVPMGDAYDAELRKFALEEARNLEISLAEGVYAGLLGPTYETPAEVRYLRTIGAEAVGMSTVPEVIAARALGMRVLGLSLITNAAGGIELSHEEVLAVGRRAAEDLKRLLSAILARL